VSLRASFYTTRSHRLIVSSSRKSYFWWVGISEISAPCCDVSLFDSATGIGYRIALCYSEALLPTNAIGDAH
jgi:hypothetical protein